MSDNSQPCYSCGSSAAVTVTTGVYNNTQTLSHGDCEGITVDLLIMFRRLMQCISSSGLYSAAGVSQADVENGINIINLWIAAKQQDPATCEYQEKLPLLQAIANKIVIYGQC